VALVVVAWAVVVVARVVPVAVARPPAKFVASMDMMHFVAASGSTMHSSLSRIVNVLAMP
jgi:hypothetical protein